MALKNPFLVPAAVLVSLSLVGCDPEKVDQAANPEENKPVEVAQAPAAALAPLKEAPADGDEVAVLETGKGKIVLMFYPERAPKHVENFKALVKSGFYDGTRFHRTIKGFMIQGGDPLSKNTDNSANWGTGGNVVDGKEKNVVAEFNDIDHVRGILSMARSQDPNSASSQFFIVHADSAFLNGQYTAFGKAIEGMDVVDEIARTPVKDENGTVYPTRAVLLKKATIEVWPLKK